MAGNLHEPLGRTGTGLQRRVLQLRRYLLRAEAGTAATHTDLGRRAYAPCPATHREYGDAWHPSRQSPEFVTRNLAHLYEQVEAEGRSSDEITISLKRSLHFSDRRRSVGLRRWQRDDGAGISANTQYDIEDIKKCADIGIHQLTYDLPTNDIEECIRILEHFAEKVAPAAQ